MIDDFMNREVRSSGELWTQICSGLPGVQSGAAAAEEEENRPDFRDSFHPAEEAAGWAEGPAAQRAEGQAAGRAEGPAAGWAERPAERPAAGWAEGPAERPAAGWAEGPAEGPAAGWAEGPAAQRAEGRAEGQAAGRAEGQAAGRAERPAAGRAEGPAEGPTGQANGTSSGSCSAAWEPMEDSEVYIASLENRLKKLKGQSTAVTSRDMLRSLSQAKKECWDRFLHDAQTSELFQGGDMDESALEHFKRWLIPEKVAISAEELQYLLRPSPSGGAAADQMQDDDDTDGETHGSEEDDAHSPEK